MMREERADRVIEAVIRKRKTKRIAAHRVQRSELTRFFHDSSGRTSIKFQAHEPCASLRILRPASSHTQQLSRACAHVQNRKTFQMLPLNILEQRVAQCTSISKKPIDAPQLYHASLILFRRVIALVQVLKLIAAMAETIKHSEK